ncbi:SDR family NAD(P)-dependent oxidoreductase [Reinekea blandensis]|uniref:Short chain dehydrogenase n=1 Tax=Reinekea blandensis MED297 TaxID=314283 RepID=A4BGS0_9GAMM|nr:SDR family NAD(P)-dependent oxidoreductase [Reinekea blandensis]EAR08718.1 short chain dehydrogenase [Reinekea sp. MED297] [Reinekea blandensis MED297]
MKKLCLLVGGSRGLGKAVADSYRAAGYDLVEFSRSGEAEEHVDVDLSRRETAIDAIDAQFAMLAEDDWDEVHLVLNAAVIGPIGPLGGSEPKDWWAHMDINLVMPISITGRFQAHFGDHTARRVVGFVSSGVANHALDGWSLYGATKAGVEQFMRSMALEQQRTDRPILVVNLDPGVMDTDMQGDIRKSDSAQFSQVQRFIERYETGGLADPAIIAERLRQTLESDLQTGSTVNIAGE